MVILSLAKRKYKGRSRAILTAHARLPSGKEVRKIYAATKTQCLKAGYDLYHAGVRDWMGSSSLDFPEECGLDREKCDPQELVREGWRREYEKLEGAPQRKVTEKILAAIGTQDFMKGLDKLERAALVRIIAGLTADGGDIGDEV